MYVFVSVCADCSLTERGPISGEWGGGLDISSVAAVGGLEGSYQYECDCELRL